MTKIEAIEMLSEMRSGYNFFDNSEQPSYEALSMAIKALSSEPKTADSGSVDSEMPEVKTDRTTSGDLIRKVNNENDELSCSESPNRSDLIRRQDAIRIVKGAYVKSKDIDDFYALLLTAFENILPYANTDLSGYSDRLWKSAYASGYERCRQDAIDVAKQHWYKPDIAGALAELPSAEPEQAWIPVSERLPELKRNILFTTSQGFVAEGEYDGMFDDHHAWCQYRWSATLWDDEVIAWMPLPEPYRGES